MSKQTFIVLDTNVFMQFDIWSDKIKWNELVDNEDIIFVIPIIVISEIQSLKDGKNRSARQKSRAAQCGKHLNEMMSGLDTKDLALEYLGKSFRIDVENQLAIDCFKDKLPKTEVTPDSQILGSAILFSKNLNSDVYLATDDKMLQTLCRIVNIKFIQPHDDFRVNSKESPDEKKIKTLERELNQYKNRLPKLKIGASKDLNTHNLATAYSEAYFYSNERENGESHLENAKKEILALETVINRGKNPGMFNPLHDQLADNFMGLAAIQQLPSWKRYEERLVSWLAEQEQLEMKRNMIKFVNIFLGNHGSASATNIYIELLFKSSDEDFEVFSSAPFVTPPMPLSPSQEQHTVAKEIAQNLGKPLRDQDTLSAELKSVFKIDYNHFEIKIDRLAHDSSKVMALGPFYVYTNTPIGLECRIGCEELIAIDTAQLGWRVEP